MLMSDEDEIDVTDGIWQSAKTVAACWKVRADQASENSSQSLGGV